MNTMNKKTQGNQYERMVAELMEQITGLRGLELRRQKTYSGKEATHEVDISFVYTVGELQLLFLVECKDWSRPVEKRDVQAFLHTLRDLGAHKGIIVSRTGFQDGAVSIAKANGIALLSVARRRIAWCLYMISPAMTLNRKLGEAGISLASSGIGTPALSHAARESDDEGLEFVPVETVGRIGTDVELTPLFAAIGQDVRETRNEEGQSSLGDRRTLSVMAGASSQISDLHVESGGVPCLHLLIVQAICPPLFRHKHIHK
jgi:hypothetical protein